MKIKIPFQADFKDRMLSARKTCTSRTKKYGEAGDTFEAFGVEFELYEVCRLKAQFVCLFLYKDEGFNSPQEFVDIWNKLHPRKGFDINQIVWVHFFRRLGCGATLETA